jgi:hypothetical protein
MDVMQSSVARMLPFYSDDLRVLVVRPTVLAAPVAAAVFVMAVFRPFDVLRPRTGLDFAGPSPPDFSDPFDVLRPRTGLGFAGPSPPDFSDPFDVLRPALGAFLAPTEDARPRRIFGADSAGSAAASFSAAADGLRPGLFLGPVETERAGAGLPSIDVRAACRPRRLRSEPPVDVDVPPATAVSPPPGASAAPSAGAAVSSACSGSSGPGNHGKRHDVVF